MAWPSVADFSVCLQKPRFSAQDDSLSPAKCWDGESQEFMWSRGEARKQAKLFCSLLLPLVLLLLLLLPRSLPLHLQPDSQPPRTCRFGPFVCVVLSWEEVPSRLTLRKWFQTMLVWILAGFCNCQFPYQSVCISKGRTGATSPLFSLSSFVLREVLLPLLLGLVGGRLARLLAGLDLSAMCECLCLCEGLVLA